MPCHEQGVLRELPEDIQKIFDEAAEHCIVNHIIAMKSLIALGRDTLVERGTEIYVPTPDEKQLWVDAFMFVWDEWIETVEGQGLPGKALLHEYGVIVKGRGGK